VAAHRTVRARYGFTLEQHDVDNRRTMTRSVLALAAVAAALVFVAAAPAAVPSAAPPSAVVPSQAVPPLAITNVTPANGAFVPPTPTGGITWGLTAAGLSADAQVLVTITDDPTTGPDGTLLDANRVDFFFLAPDPTNINIYNGKSDPGPNAWSANLGTYYWQVRATTTDANGVPQTTASAVQRLGIGTAPPPGTTPTPTPGQTGSSSAAGVRDTLAMSSLDAQYYVRTAIRRQTKRTPSKLSYSCGKLNSRSFRCRPTWRDAKNIYTSGLVTFTHARLPSNKVVARGTFTGRRSSRSCVARRSVKSCAVRFRWHTVTASRPIPASSASAARAAR
jgi:hypothetical protein